MPKPDYQSRVDVFRRGREAGPEPVDGLQGVTLAHAIQTIMRDWPPLNRDDALIATAKGFLRSREIHELYARPDFPGRERKLSRRRPRSPAPS
jgi:hypothetical protein